MAEVLAEIESGIAMITLNAPDRRNSFTVAMAEEFIGVVHAINDDPDIAVTIVTGAGRDFCAGGDRETLQRIGADPMTDESYHGLRRIYDAFVSFGSLATPTIAAVHGTAVGAGLNLALAADLRLVSTEARLMSGFARIGIHPGGGHFHLLGQVVGADTAAAMALFGEEVRGAEAVRLGLAWRAVPETDLLPEAQRLAQRLADRPELARSVVRSWRTQSGSLARWAAAVDIERLPQLHSMRHLHAPTDR